MAAPRIVGKVVAYSPLDVERHAARARDQHVKLGRTANGFIFRASSGSAEPQDPPEFVYTVTVVPGEGETWGAACTCKANENDSQCKHGGAAISAVMLQQVRQAAKVLARHGWRLRRQRQADAQRAARPVLRRVA